MLRSTEITTAVCAGFVFAGIATSTAARAEDAPRSYVASPDVYKVIGTVGKARVILATRQPGQRDQPHSHPPGLLYVLTPCKGGNHIAGNVRTGSSEAGKIVTFPHVESHWVENVGTTECKELIVEEE